MSDQTQSLNADIAFLRALAEEGRHTPMMGGSVLLASGLIFGAANGAGLLLSLFHARMDGPLGLILTLGSLVLFMAVLAALKRRVAGQPGVSSPVNRAVGGAWRGIGLAIMVLIAALILASWRLGDWRLMTCLPIVIFALYGAGFHIAAVMSRQAWIKAVAFLSYATALAGGLLAGRMLASNTLFTAGLFLLVALPGYLMMRQSLRRSA